MKRLEISTAAIRLDRVVMAAVAATLLVVAPVAAAPVLKADAGSKQLICGNSLTAIGGNPTASGGTPPYTYLWDPADTLNFADTSNPQAGPAVDTVYTVTVTDSLGNTDSDSVAIDIRPNTPEVIIGPDLAICPGETVVLDAQVNANGSLGYQWLPVEGLSDPTNPYTEATPTETTTYTLTVTDTHGCTGSESVTVVVQPDTATFVDVSKEHPFFKYVESVFAAKITGGCSVSPLSYCPDAPITREQMAVFITRALGLSPAVPAQTCFDDVPTNDPFAPAICELASLGISGGCSTTPLLFCPDAPVSRAEMAVFLLRAIQKTPASGNACFEDVAVDSVYAPWICELFASSITGGCLATPLNYCPNDPATRGQMAVYVTRTFGLPTDVNCATKFAPDLPSKFPEGSVGATAWPAETGGRWRYRGGSTH